MGKIYVIDVEFRPGKLVVSMFQFMTGKITEIMKGL